MTETTTTDEEMMEEAPELPSSVLEVPVRCGRCLERRFFCLTTPDSLNVLTLICSGCGDILPTGISMKKVADKKSKQKREEKSFNRDDILYTG